MMTSLISRQDPHLWVMIFVSLSKMSIHPLTLMLPFPEQGFKPQNKSSENFWLRWGLKFMKLTNMANGFIYIPLWGKKKKKCCDIFHISCQSINIWQKPSTNFPSKNFCAFFQITDKGVSTGANLNPVWSIKIYLPSVPTCVLN